jgi:dipeptidyl aminopeptidase/acylaminoacyl peptidase
VEFTSITLATHTLDRLWWRKVMCIPKILIRFSLGVLFSSIASGPIGAQTNASSPAPTDSLGYNLPPDNILSVMRAPSPPVPFVSPTSDSILLVTWQEYPPIARVSAPFLRLAGARIEPKNHSKHDTLGGYGITPCATGFELVRVADGKQTPVPLPGGMCPGGPEWAADGKRFAFVNIAADSVQLWIGDASTGSVNEIPGVHLNPMLGQEMQWMPDQKTLLVKLVPRSNDSPPQAVNGLAGPSIQETNGQKGQSSTYETRDTLGNSHDEDLFDYFALSQLAFVDSVTFAVTPFGKAANYESLDPAPDGRHILVTTIHKPYSYVVAYDRFPKEVEVWDTSDCSKVTVHTVVSLPMADRVPIRGARTGPRDFSWRATEPATLVWAEALDGGDWKVNVPHRDKILLQKAPFTSPAAEIGRTEQRYFGLRWSEQPSIALLEELDMNRHWRRTFIIDVDNPQATPRLLWDLSTDDRYKNPGFPVYRQRQDGVRVIRQEADSIFLSGAGSSPDGDRAFLDRLDLKTLKTERLFRSDKNAYERFLSFTGPGAHAFLTWHQSPIDPPNAVTRTLGPSRDAPDGEAAFGSTAVALTHIPDPTPQVRAIKKRLVTYKRGDGLDLSFTLYTPPSYQEGIRLPTILYAYPRDYAQSSTAGQVVGSQQTFTSLQRYRLLLLAGYAIIDNASFPIVGDPKKAYDTYLEQLIADAKAAVDEGVRLGVVDPNRVGATGHSHGALMTVNLVAHSDLFRAGVATSGAYNKTLTPFGFQNERRSVWEATDVYLKVSPYFSADKLKAPILIMHGAEDANPGTTPLQSIKLYEAIRGNGGTARLVMLPHEPHHYTAMESNEQEVYEMVRWFDKYVKNAQPVSASRETTQN